MSLSFGPHRQGWEFVQQEEECDLQMQPFVTSAGPVHPSGRIACTGGRFFCQFFCHVRTSVHGAKTIERTNFGSRIVECLNQDGKWEVLFAAAQSAQDQPLTLCLFFSPFLFPCQVLFFLFLVTG